MGNTRDSDSALAGGISYLVWASIVLINTNPEEVIKMPGEVTVAALSGAIVGALITAGVSHISSRTREKSKFTLDVIGKFIEKTSEVGIVYGLIENRDNFDESLEKDANKKTICNTNYNRILEFGNWLEIICCFYMDDSIDRPMIRKTKLLDTCNNLITKARESNYLDGELENVWPNIIRVTNSKGESV